MARRTGIRPWHRRLAGRRPWGPRVAVASGLGIVLLATSIGVVDAATQRRSDRQRVRTAAATVSFQDSHATLQAGGFDGQGTFHSNAKGDSDFLLFDKTARFDDTDDRPRGAAAKARQLTTINDDGSSIVVTSRSDANASYYDRRTGDDIRPEAEGNELLIVTIDVAGGGGDKAFFALRGSIHGEASGGGSSGCAKVEVTAPNGTIIQGGGSCVGSFTIPIDESGPLDPGPHTLQVDSSAEANPGFPFARAKTTWDLSLVLSGCDVLGTSGDDPSLDGTPGDDVICGLGGADSIDAGDGDDTVFGGDGGDKIDGGRGVDAIFGGDGPDGIQGGNGRDAVFGGLGGDDIEDRLGPNVLDGGEGIDFVCGSPQRDTIRGGADADILRGLGGPDRISGDAGDDGIFGDATSPSCPPGGPGASRRDVIHGGAGDDVIKGGPDRDAIRGSGGKDNLFGEADNDKLNACDGARDDAVAGGPGGNDVVRRDNVDPSSGNEVRRPC
jgi:Ca2+-binding RTX toxin-like protein